MLLAQYMQFIKLSDLYEFFNIYFEFSKVYNLMHFLFYILYYKL